jgi:hypothetical protein
VLLLITALKVQGATVQVQSVLVQMQVPVSLAQLHGTLATAQLLLRLMNTGILDCFQGYDVKHTVMCLITSSKLETKQRH